MCYCTSVLVQQQIGTRRQKGSKIMTIRTSRQVPSTLGESRRPQFPIDQQSGSLFLGWGPKI
jgi:hypothetical protein